MRRWSKACAVCKTHRERPCELCVNHIICKTAKTDYCFTCADAGYCQSMEATGWEYQNGEWVYYGPEGEGPNE